MTFRVCASLLLVVAACSSERSSERDADVTGDVDPDGGADATDLGADPTDDASDSSDVAPDVGPDTDSDVAPGRTLDPYPEWVEPPACGSRTSWPGLIPGPGDEGFDAELAANSRRLERQFQALNTYGTGLNADTGIAGEEARETIAEFILETDEWDFEEWSGESPESVIGNWNKVAGAYGGVGIAANAYRYAVLLREGADCDDIERARAYVVESLDALHLAQAITGEPGVIARGFASTLTPGSNHETVPLFDDDGNPLPEEKNNGTWREDNSGLYPDYVWEDSASRDQVIGWVIGMAGAWEVIRDDPTFDQALKDRLQDDVLALAVSLMTVQESGYDLEIRDADGRMTYHGILHEASIDRAYFPGAKNGFNALMSLGIMGALAYVSEDPEVEAYVYDELIENREFLVLINDFLIGVDLGHRSNFSAYNMAFEGGWLAMRYLRDPEARAEAARAVRDSLYDRGGEHQPVEMKQTFFDLTQAIAVNGASVFRPPHSEPDEEALARGMETLTEWPRAPYYDRPSENCDEEEIELGDCTAIDGSHIEVLGYIGRNSDLVAAAPIPMRIRGGSNWWWRSNPYKVDIGGSPNSLLPGSDYRWAYWSARWIRRAAE